MATPTAPQLVQQRQPMRRTMLCQTWVPHRYWYNSQAWDEQQLFPKQSTYTQMNDYNVTHTTKQLTEVHWREAPLESTLRLRKPYALLYTPNNNLKPHTHLAFQVILQPVMLPLTCLPSSAKSQCTTVLYASQACRMMFCCRLTQSPATARR